MEKSRDQKGNGEARMIFRCFAWILLCCLKFSLESHSHSAQGCKEGSKNILPREEMREEIVAPGYSPVAPCLNGRIGAGPMGGKGKGSAVTARSDSWAAALCVRRRGHPDSHASYSDSLPMS
jgi:hypothetical protein